MSTRSRKRISGLVLVLLLSLMNTTPSGQADVGLIGSSFFGDCFPGISKCNLEVTKAGGGVADGAYSRIRTIDVGNVDNVVVNSVALYSDEDNQVEIGWYREPQHAYNQWQTFYVYQFGGVYHQVDKTLIGNIYPPISFQVVYYPTDPPIPAQFRFMVGWGTAWSAAVNNPPWTSGIPIVNGERYDSGDASNASVLAIHESMAYHNILQTNPRTLTLWPDWTCWADSDLRFGLEDFTDAWMTTGGGLC